jgi:hypothetical protein
MEIGTSTSKRTQQRWKLREEAAEFFLFFARLEGSVAIENPVGYMNTMVFWR